MMMATAANDAIGWGRNSSHGAASWTMWLPRVSPLCHHPGMRWARRLMGFGIG